jgi:arabinogalactan oligomer/maltooligosaccharide transport system substrate-binding protein
MKKSILFFVILGLMMVSGCSRIAGLMPEARQTAPSEGTESSTATVQVRPTSTPLVTLSPTADITQGTITIWHSWSEDQMQTLSQILDDFSAEYPEVLFDVLYIPQENLRARLETAYQEGGGPDIILGPAEWGPSLYQDGIVVDLNELADNRFLETINPAALDGARFQGALTGLPYAQQGAILYRNKALIPEAATTFDQLVESAKAATQGEIFGADLERGFLYSGGHLGGLGGEWINEDGTPAFNNETGLAWLELLKAFEQAGPTEYLSDRDLDLFKEGRAGWIIDGTWNLNDLSDAIGLENLAIDPWPAYKNGSMAGFVLPSNIYLSASSEEDDRKASWKFIEYFLTPENQSRLVNAGLIPVVGGVKIVDPRQEILLTQVLTALAGGVPYPSNPDFQLYLTPLDVALQSTLVGQTPPAEALNNAEQAVLNALAQAKATPTP